MRKNSKNKNRPVNRWNDADRRAFADGNRLRAQTIQGKRFGGAEVDEWDWDEDEDLAEEPCDGACTEGLPGQLPFCVCGGR